MPVKGWLECTLCASSSIAVQATGEVDVASILEQKHSTKLYWENKMAATAAPPSEDLGWEPVANVCFRDPNAPLETTSTEDSTPETSAGADYLPAPPPQFDNTPPVSIEEAKENNHKLEQERIISLDDEISVLEREVLGEVVASDIEEDIEEITETHQLVEEAVKTNHKYVYGEEGAQETVPKVPAVVQNRRGDPDRLPTVKSTYSATRGKENVIEAEIRAQQERERELQLEQMKKKEILQQNMQNSSTTELMRHKGASSPHDSDEGFVDPPVERPKLEATTKQTVSVVCSDSGYAHVVTDHDGESVIYDAVAPPNIISPRPEPGATSCPSPVTPKSAPKSTPPAPVPHTTETKIALEIRELKEREEELRRMREARQGVKKISNGGSVNGDEHEEDFAEVDIEDTEDRGSSSSREILDDHLTSLTTTTDEGNFSECGDATSSEDKSSNGSNSRITSPEVPSGEYPRPSRRVTVRPFQADDDDDRPVYTRMKNESVIEREIRIAKERDEAYKKEKGLLIGTRASSKPGTSAATPTTNGVVKHESLRQSVSLSAVPNGSNKGAQHQLATNRIQLEIAENGQRERELMSAGKVLTLSEDTVDDKVARLSDLIDLPTAQELRTKSPNSSTSVSSSTRQSPTISPHSTLSNSSRSSNNGLSNGFSNGHHFNGSTMTRLTKSLSTTNLSSPQSSLSSTATGMRPKGLMEKFIASRGKMTQSAFTSGPTMGGGSGRVVATRPMRVQPKKPVLLRQHSNDSADGSSQMALELRTEVKTSPSPPPPHLYKRVIGAEEKIQEELREMQQREEELKRQRSKSLTARSQPNLLEMSLNEIPFEDHQGSTTAEDETDTATETEDSTDTLVRVAVSNPNLVDEVSENASVKKVNYAFVGRIGFSQRPPLTLEQGWCASHGTPKKFLR
ncbi:A-kinase anchor protein 2 C-terminal domain [Trinorchestia longiramus]|nr:A-kinase anchor protein 2 C-terminal domain [Trinorchestia longiramus]